MQMNNSDEMKQLDKGNSLIEVLVALSLLSLLTLTTALGFNASKRLEKKTLWQAVASTSALSITEASRITEAGYPTEAYLAKNNGVVFWRSHLQNIFPGSDIQMAEGAVGVTAKEGSGLKAF